jgi:hypothetical protein
MDIVVLDATEDQLGQSQGKLTFLGPQTKPVPTVVFSAENHTPAIQAFVPFHLSRRPYQNDDLPYTVTFMVSRTEFMRLLKAVRPLVVMPGSGSDLISFTVVHESPNGKSGGEFMIKESLAEAFYRAAIGALSADNVAGQKALSDQAAKSGLKF